MFRASWQKTAAAAAAAACPRTVGQRAHAIEEAAVAVACQGPHLSKLLDVFADDSGRRYLVYEWGGASLSSLIAKASLPLPAISVRAVVLHVARGLQVIHRSGLVHTDIKPANILVREMPADGWWCMVADFGSAEEVRLL
jgi:serine/threonine protein kinase